MTPGGGTRRWIRVFAASDAVPEEDGSGIGTSTHPRAYSTFARGLEDFLTAYRYIDIAPKGRDEEQVGGMGWLRHHDRYEDTNFVVPWAEKPGITAPIIPK